MEVISLKIGEKIRTLRKRKGMTQLELSEKVHVSPQAVSMASAIRKRITVSSTFSIFFKYYHLLSVSSIS